MKISLTNTLSRKKETFEPLQDNKITLYTCGITPYDNAHLGHGRCYTNFDVLVRFFKFMGYDVTYVRNYTDIDDKILNKAQAEGDVSNYKHIPKKFIQAYQEDMEALNCVEPEHEPRVTENIPEIITFIQGLITNGSAYAVDHDVYFDISSFDDYGKLSGKKIDELEAGSRVQVDTRKKNPGDFALWKGNNEGLFWESPWGHGRPAWHIECSVLAKKFLNVTIDIHAGGADLMFPHHENEIAQSEALHKKPFARYWLHNAFVNINEEKMSKSLGNFITLKKLFDTFDPMVVRFFFLQHHYRTPINFNDQELAATQTAYKKLIARFQDAKGIGSFEQCKNAGPIFNQMIEALCDDINTPKFLGIVFQNIDAICDSSELFLATKTLLQTVLGLTLQPLKEKTIEITSEIETLLKQREQARTTRDWKRADEIRNQLVSLGVKIQDKKV